MLCLHLFNFARDATILLTVGGFATQAAVLKLCGLVSNQTSETNTGINAIVQSPKVPGALAIYSQNNVQQQ